MIPDDHFRHVGILSSAVITGALALMLYIWGRDHSASLSKHAARHTLTYLLFLVSLFIGGVLFYLFATRWLGPTLGVSAIFSIVLVLATACEFIAAIVPDSGGTRSRIHQSAAWSMALLMLVLILLIMTAPAAGALVRAVSGLAAMYMLIDLGLFLFVKATHKYFLFFQSTYIGVFYVAVISTAYL